MTKWRSRALTLALAGFMAWQAVLPVSADVVDAAEEPTEVVETELPAAEETPTEGNDVPAPAEETPVEEGAGTAPTPVEEGTPVEEVPAEEVPTEEVIVEETPVEAPVEEEIVEEAPVEEVLADDVIVEETSTEEPVATPDTGSNDGTQAALSLPDGYVETDSLTTLTEDAQRNGRDSGSSSEGQLVKTAEWTDYETGEGEITLTYAVPQHEATSAVYFFGTCINHGFNFATAQKKTLELTQVYDEVTVISVHHRPTSNGWDSEDIRNGTCYPVEAVFYKADSQETNTSKFVSTFQSSSILSDDDGCSGDHVTGLLAMDYLADALDDDPTAVYVDMDGERLFAGSALGTSTGYQWYGDKQWGQTYDEMEDISYYLYGMSPENLAATPVSELQSHLQLGTSLIKKLADYQMAGCYYVGIPNNIGGSDSTYQYLSTAYYNDSNSSFAYEYNFDGHRVDATYMRNMCYASFAYIDPYNYINNQDLIIQYLSNGSGSRTYNDAYWKRVGPEVLYYGKTVLENGQNIVYNSATITDTIADGLKIDKDNIAVTVNGSTADPKCISISVIDNKVAVSMTQINVGDVVRIAIPVVSTGTNGEFQEDNSFKKTNVGDATAVAADGKTVSVASPKLYKGELPEEPPAEEDPPKEEDTPKEDDTPKKEETNKTTTNETTNNKTTNNETVNNRTENIQVINKVVTNEAITETGAAATPAPVGTETPEEVVESGEAIITTGDESPMQTYAGISLMSAAILAAWLMRKRSFL